MKIGTRSGSSWLMLAWTATVVQAAVETPAPSLICSDVPSRRIITVTPSHEPSPTFFIRGRTRNPTQGPTGSPHMPTDNPTTTPTKVPTDVPTTTPTAGSCAGSLLDNLSLVGPAGQTVIPILESGDVWQRLQVPHKVYVQATTSSDQVDAVLFTLNGEESVDYAAPFVVEETDVLGVAGTHTISAQAVHFSHTNVGCFQDNWFRMFPYHLALGVEGWTAERCAMECGHLGYPFAGAQASNHCFCGTQTQYDAAVAGGKKIADASCNMPCAADDTQICGGSWINSVYQVHLEPVGDTCEVTLTTEFEVEGRTCDGMIPTLSLLTGPKGQIVKHLTTGTNQFNLLEYPYSFDVRANAHPELVTYVTFTIDGTTVIEDREYPFIADTSELLKEIGPHTILAEAKSFDIEELGCHQDFWWRTLPHHIRQASDWSHSKCAIECGLRGYEYAGSQASGHCFCGSQSDYDSRGTYVLDEALCNGYCWVEPRENCGGSWKNWVSKITAIPDGPACSVDVEIVLQDPEAICSGVVPGMLFLEGERPHDVIGPVQAGTNVINLLEELEGVIIEADVPEGLIGSVKFTVDDDAYEYVDAVHPFRLDTAEGIRSLALLGTHKLKIQAQHFGYIGCYYDDWSRFFDEHLSSDTSQYTATECAMACAAANFPYSASQAAGHCFCGTLAEWEIYKDKGKVDESLCDLTCKKDASQICGGNLRNSVYDTGLTDNAYGDPCEVEILAEYDREGLICSGMIPALSVVNATDEEEIQVLESGKNVVNMVQYPDGFSIQAFAQALFVPTVKFTITSGSGDYEPIVFTDSNEPFVAPGNQVSKYLARPGTHQISVESVDYSYLGCYNDPWWPRFFSLQLVGWGWDTLQCYNACIERVYYESGVPYNYDVSSSSNSGACRCGTYAQLKTTTLADSEDECNTPCPYKPEEMCGGAERASVFGKLVPAPDASCGAEITTVYESENKVCEGMIQYFSLVSAETGEVIEEVVGKSGVGNSCAEGTVVVTPDIDDYHTGDNPQCVTSGAFFCQSNGGGNEAFGSTPDTQTLTCSNPSGGDVMVGLTKLSNSEVILEVLTPGYVMSDVLVRAQQGGRANLYEWFGANNVPRGASRFENFLSPNNPGGQATDISYIVLCLMEEPVCDGPATAVFDMNDWPRGGILRAEANPDFVPAVVWEIDDEYAKLDVEYPFEATGAEVPLSIPGTHSVRMQAVELEYVGCYADYSGSTFSVTLAIWTARWPATKCVIECQKRGYAYSGSQAGGACFCGTEEELAASGNPLNYWDCYSACASAPNQRCGAWGRNSVYKTTLKPLSPACEVDLEVIYDNEPHECEGMISSLALIDTGTDEVIEGKESLLREGNLIEIEKYEGVTVRANTVLAPTVQFSVAGNDNYMTDSIYPFTLTGTIENPEGGWDYQPSALLALPGTHEVRVRAIELGYEGCYKWNDGDRPFATEIFGWNNRVSAMTCRVECGNLDYPYSLVRAGGMCYCGTQQEMDDARSENLLEPEGSCGLACVTDASQICGGWGQGSAFATAQNPLSDWCSTEVTTVYQDPPTCPGIVSGLVLYDASNAQALHELADGNNIVLTDTSGMLTIRAIVPEVLRQMVKKIRFELDDVVKDDATFPYYMNGDFDWGTRVDPEPRLLVPGTHSLKVYAQLTTDTWEMEERYCEIQFTVNGEDNGPCSGIIQSLSLIDAESNGLVTPFMTGRDQVDLSRHPSGITVRANTHTTGYQPVHFVVSNLNVGDVESTSIYFPHTISETIISGDQRYNYTASDIISVSGAHTIKAAAIKTDYKGCYRDSEDRIFTGAWIRQYDVAGCIVECRNRGFAYAGLQAAHHCFCGTEEEFKKEANERRPEIECGQDCTPNSLMKCGGHYRNSIYGTEESEYTGEWCESELTTIVGGGDATCSGAINGFSILIVGGGSVQSLNGYNQINGGLYYVMDMENFPAALTVRANIVQEVQEVRFYVNDTLVMTEYLAPFVLAGKANFTDFIYKSDIFATLGVHEIKAVAVLEGQTEEDEASGCDFTLEISGLPDEPEDPSVPIYDPKTTVDFLLLAEHRCKPTYVDGTAETSSFFFKTLGEITNTTHDENVTFTTSNYFTMEGDGMIDYMTTVYQDAGSGEIVCEMVSNVPAGASGGEFVGKCDSGNFSYFSIYAFDEDFTADDNADYSDLPEACKPPSGATIGGARKFTFAVPCDCTDLNDEPDYGDEIPPGTLVAASWGDPHIVTWDNTKYDCQVVGEVTLFKAKLLDYDWHFGNEDYASHTIELQMRYAHMDAFFIRDVLVSMGVGMVIKEKRKVQLAIAEDPVGKPRVGDCAIDFYLDDVRTDFLQGIDEDDLIVAPAGSYVNMFFPKTGAVTRVQITRMLTADGSTQVCAMSLYGGIPMNNPAIYDVTGMWGTPDGLGGNDFLNSAGEVIDPPSQWSHFYYFCQENWCNRDESKSLFVYEEGKQFSDYEHCFDYEWNGDYNFDLLDEQSAYICSMLGEHMFVEQCRIDGLLGGLNMTLQFYLDISEFTGLREDGVTPTGDSDNACCSGDFKACATGDKCKNIWACGECMGDSSKPWVWLHRGGLEAETCSPLDGPCVDVSDCCSSGRAECTDGKCVHNGESSLRRRGRRRHLKEFGGFDTVVPRGPSHALPYRRKSVYISN